jgi:hypothetical protein
VKKLSCSFPCVCTVFPYDFCHCPFICIIATSSFYVWWNRAVVLAKLLRIIQL